MTRTRKLPLFITAITLSILTGMVRYTPVSAANTASFADTTVREQVIVDEQGVKITVMGYEVSEWGMEEVSFPVTIENTTDADITVRTTLTSVNGFMMDPHWHADVEAGKTATDEIGFYVFELEECGIEKVAEVELSFTVTSEDASVNFTTAPGTIQTSNYGRYTQSYDDSGEVLIDDAGIRVIAKELDTNNYGAYQYLYIENNTDATVHLHATEHKINGNSVPDLESNYPDITPGKKSREALGYGNGDLSKAGAKNVESVSARMTVTNADTNEEILSETIFIGGDSSALVSAPATVQGVAYQDDFVEVSVGEIDASSVGDTTLPVSIKNVSATELTYSFDHVKVNGQDADGTSGQGIAPDFLEKIEVGGTYETTVKIHRNSLRALGITQIQSIEIGMTFMNYQAVIHDIAFEVPFAEDNSVTTSLGSGSSAEISMSSKDYAYEMYTFTGGNDNLYILYELTNPNDVAVHLKGTLQFKDKDGNVLDTDSDELQFISAGKYNFMIFRSEKTEASNVSLTVQPWECADSEKGRFSFDVTDLDGGGIKVSLTNADIIDIEVQMSVILFKNGRCIGFRRGFGDGVYQTVAPGQTVIREITDVDFDHHYEYITALKR